jgi:regulator of protease activity HflC (stomatin/prohibitin superfamily)
MRMGFVALIILCAFFLLLSIRIPLEDERIVIFRFRRLFRVVGPGLVLMIPIVDKGVRVKLSDRILGWQELSKEQLEEQIIGLPEIKEVKGDS